MGNEAKSFETKKKVSLAFFIVIDFGGVLGFGPLWASIN